MLLHFLVGQELDPLRYGVLRQLAMMLQMHGSKSDAAKMSRLEEHLKQRQSEVEQYRQEVVRLKRANEQVEIFLPR
jgi:hypothetical protein